MTNEEIILKCEAKKEDIMEEINSTPKGWKLWIIIDDDNIYWTTVYGNSVHIGPSKLVSTWYYQPKKKSWSEIKETLWRDLYNSRGDN